MTCLHEFIIMDETWWPTDIPFYNYLTYYLVRPNNYHQVSIFNINSLSTIWLIRYIHLTSKTLLSFAKKPVVKIKIQCQNIEAPPIIKPLPPSFEVPPKARKSRIVIKWQNSITNPNTRHNTTTTTDIHSIPFHPTTYRHQHQHQQPLNISPLPNLCCHGQDFPRHTVTNQQTVVAPSITFHHNVYDVMTHTHGRTAISYHTSSLNISYWSCWGDMRHRVTFPCSTSRTQWCVR